MKYLFTLLLTSFCAFGQSWLVVDNQGRLIGTTTNFVANYFPWLNAGVSNQFIATDENGVVTSLDLPEWWPNPAFGGEVLLAATNEFTSPGYNKFSTDVEFVGDVLYRGTLTVSNLYAPVLEIENSIAGDLIGEGVNATNITAGILPSARLDTDIVRTTSPTISDLAVTGSITLNDISISSWPSGGSSGDGSSIFTLLTTNATPVAIFTNNVETNTTAFAIVDVMAAGPTNLAHFRLSASTHDNNGTRMSLTNILLSNGGAHSLVASWTVSSGIAQLFVTGHAVERYNWLANIKLHTVFNATTNPASFAYNIEEEFETDPNSDWTLETGLTNYYAISYTTNPIVGSGSLRIISPTTSVEASHPIVRQTIVDYGTEHWGTALFEYPDAHPATEVEIMRVGSGRFLIRTDGTPRLKHNTITVGSSGNNFAVSTTYRLWWYYRPSSGTDDGIFQVWRGAEASTDRSAATLIREITNGDGTGLPSVMRLEALKTTSATYASEFKWDSLKVASAEFTTVP